MGSIPIGGTHLNKLRSHCHCGRVVKAQALSTFCIIFVNYIARGIEWRWEIGIPISFDPDFGHFSISLPPPLLLFHVFPILLLRFYRHLCSKNICDIYISINPTHELWYFVFLLSALILLTSFCRAAGLICRRCWHTYFHWPVFHIYFYHYMHVYNNLLL